MPNFFSPGVYTVEKDISTYPVAGNSSIVGIVGFAGKGPTNVATLITSPENLINTFGNPSEDLDGQGLEGALEILETTNAVYYVRAAGDSATEASAVIGLGIPPAIEVSSGGYGLNNSLYLVVQVTDYNQNNLFLEPRVYAIPAGTVTGAVDSSGAQYLAMSKVIGGALDTDYVIYGAINNALGHTIYGAYAGQTASISVSSYSDADLTIPVSAVRPIFGSGITSPYSPTFSGIPASALADDKGFTSSIKVFGANIGGVVGNTATTSGVGYLVNSLYPGTGYNYTVEADGTVLGNSIETDALGRYSKLAVNELGSETETFKVSLVSANFIEDIINVGLTNRTSDYIKGKFVSGTGLVDFDATPITNISGGDPELGWANSLGLLSSTPITYGGFIYNSSAGGVLSVARSGGDILQQNKVRLLKLLDQTSNMSGGTNGVGTASENDAAIIGSAAETPKTGIYALDYDDLNISIAITPGKNSQNVQNSLITLAETSQNFLALVAPPYGSINTVQEALDWSNGRSETRTAAINSSYAAIYWPWVKVFSTFDGVDRWYDPTIYAARQMCFTDSVADTWFAPAGFRRGRLTKPTEVEVNLNQGDRDSMYSGGNVINPIVSFPQAGIAIFGQRTAQRTSTALDRVNVRRLMIYLRKAVLNSTQSFVFEPNDPFTWEAIRDVINPLLEDIRSRRGITNYSVICDETTNTPVRVDRNELWCKVVIQPTKAAEIIVFELNVTNQSAKLGG